MLPIVVVVALRGRDEQDVDTALAVLRACSNCYHGLRFSPNCDSVVRDWGWSSGVADEGGQRLPHPTDLINAEFLRDGRNDDGEHLHAARASSPIGRHCRSAHFAHRRFLRPGDGLLRNVAARAGRSGRIAPVAKGRRDGCPTGVEHDPSQRVAAERASKISCLKSKYKCWESSILRKTKRKNNPRYSASSSSSIERKTD